MDKIFAKLNMKENIKLIVSGVLLSLLFSFLLLDLFKEYKATITIVAIPKSQVLAAENDQVLGNIIANAKTLAFYDQLLKSNSDVRDIASEQSSFARKLSWNQMLEIERLNRKASVIEVSISAKRQSDAQLLVQKTVRSLFDATSFIYNVKDDLDLRIIDGPITKVSFPYWPFIVIFSIMLGFGMAMVFDFLFSQAQDKIKQQITPRSFAWPTFVKSKPAKPKENEVKQEESANGGEEHFEFENVQSQVKKETGEPVEIFEVSEPRTTEFTEEKAEYFKEKQQDNSQAELEALNKIIEHDIYPNYPEMPKAKGTTAGAPSNLPVADEEFLQRVSASGQETEKVQTEEEKEQKKTEEPTQEELKKRLNHLLRGGM